MPSFLCFEDKFDIKFISNKITEYYALLGTHTSFIKLEDINLGERKRGGGEEEGRKKEEKSGERER